MASSNPIVDVRGLTVEFTGGMKPVRAVAGVDLSLAKGEVLALLGEFGVGQERYVASLDAPSSAEALDDRGFNSRGWPRCAGAITGRARGVSRPDNLDGFSGSGPSL